MRKLLFFFFSHRTLALLRWDLHFFKIRISNVLFFKKRRLDRLVRDAGDTVFLNLGSGPLGLKQKEWINIDGFWDKNVQYVCDFGRRLPFANNSFDGIFCEHVLEHFGYINGKKLMQECFRILKKDGVIRIIVPDGETIMRSYFNHPEFIVEYKHCENKFPMEAVNTWFYQRYEHQCIYDEPYLTDMLKNIGFSLAIKESYGSTTIGNKNLLIDDQKYKWESLYVEAIK